MKKIFHRNSEAGRRFLRPNLTVPAFAVGVTIIALVLLQIAEQPLLTARIIQLPAPALDRLKQLGSSQIHPYRYPVALARRGDMLLIKSKKEEYFDLEIHKGPQLIASLKTFFNPWELTWDPSGQLISYLAETGKPGIYGLNLWRVGERYNGLVDAPLTRSAAFPIRWSPDGRFLAYTVYNHESSKIVIIATSNRSVSSVVTIPDIDPDAGYAWSADSKQLAYSPSSVPTSIQLYSVLTHSTRHLVSLSSAKLVGLTWSPSSHDLLASIRDPSDDFFRLARLSMNRAVTYCSTAGADLVSPMWTGRNETLAYLAKAGRLTRLYLGRSCSEMKLIMKMKAGSIRLQNDGYSHQDLAALSSGPMSPTDLMLIKNEIAPPTTISAETSHLENAIHIEPVTVSTTNNVVPAWLWRDTVRHSQQYGLVILHGGPHLEDSGEWEPMRSALAKDGIAVLSINYSGSSGYGAEFENSSDLDTQVAELNAAVAYLKASQDIGSENITILAASYGTQILLEALRRTPTLCGTIVLAPLLINTNASENATALQYKGKIMAFHGALDPLCPPDVAVKYLQHLFTGPVMHRPAITWRVFPNEGHGFSRIASLQEIYATIDCTIKQSCDRSIRGER